MEITPATLTADSTLAGISPRTTARPLVALLKKIPWALLALLAMMAGYGIFLWLNFLPAAIEPDANGYWAQGSLLMQTGRTTFTPASPIQYIGMHWLVMPSGDYISRYPPGLAVLIGVVYQLLGYKASVMVNPVLAVLTLPGVFLLARRWMGRWGALAAVALVAANPTYCYHAIACFAHMPVAFCLVWGIYALLAWHQHGKWWRIFLAGLLLGCIPTIRYPDGLVGLGVMVLLICDIKRFPRIYLHWLAGLAGALIPITPLLIRNQLLMGAFWRTGYSLTNEETGFGWSYFTQHAIPYIQQIQGEGLGLLFILSLVGMTWMMCLQRMWRAGLLLTLLTLPLIVLYMFYYWAMAGQGDMRFLMPIFPLMSIAGIWALVELCRHVPLGAKIAIPLVVIAMQLLWGTNTAMANVAGLHDQRAQATDVTDALDRVAGPEDLVLASPQLEANLDFVRHWKVGDMSLLPGQAGRMGGFGGNFNRQGDPSEPGTRGFGRGNRGFRNNNDPEAPSPQQIEKSKVVMDKLYGQEKDQEKMKEIFILAALKWAGKGKIFLVGTASQLDSWEQVLNVYDAKEVAKIEVKPVARRGFGMGGRGFRDGMPFGPPPGGAQGGPFGGAQGGPGGPPPGPGGPGPMGFGLGDDAGGQSTYIYIEQVKISFMP